MERADSQRSAGAPSLARASHSWSYAVGSVVLLAAASEACVPGAPRPDKLTSPAMTVTVRATPGAAVGAAARPAPRTVAMGRTEVCAIGGDRRVYCWGTGDVIFALHDGHRRSSVPLPLAGVHDAVTVSVGDGRACVLREQGKVTCFGDTSEVDLARLPRARALSVGRGPTCIAAEDGSVWCWGGTGSHAAKAELRRIGGITDAIDIAVDGSLACAVGASGEVTCWNGGDAAPESTTWPPGAAQGDVVSLSTRELNVCLRRSDGSARCYTIGHTAFGPLESREDDDASWKKLAPVLDIAVGRRHGCAVRGDGQVMCFGIGVSGSLGFAVPGTSGAREVPLLAPALSVAAGYDASCARLRSGEVACWGDGASGQLGNGWPEAHRDGRSPRLGEPALDLRASGSWACALLRSGGVRCWGDGKLTPHDPLEAISRKQTQAGDPFVEIAPLDTETGCARTHAGRVECWGEEGSSALGDPRAAAHQTSRPAVTDVVSLVASNHVCALDRRGDVFCWGANENGEAGGSKSEVMSPRRVANLGHALSIAVGDRHSCALLASGVARCWGDAKVLMSRGAKASGALFDFPAVNDVAGLVTHEDATCVLRTGAPPRCFGSALTDADGEPPALAKARRYWLSRGLGCTLDEQGEVRCFGNQSALLGTSAMAEPGKPVTLAMKTPVAQLALGEDFACALGSSGEVKCFGAWARGQLGTGDAAYSAQPVVVRGVPPTPAR